MNVALVGIVLRRFGALTMFVGSMLLALHPSTVTATHNVVLDPWMLFFALAGWIAAFGGDGRLSSRSRTVGGALLLGLAVSIKLWALLFLLPVMVVAVVARRRVGFVEIAGASALSFTAVSGWIVAAAPVEFVRFVLFSQIGRPGDGVWQLGLAERITLTMGLGDYPFRSGTSDATSILLVVVAVAAVIVMLCVTQLRSTDFVVVGTFALSAVAFSVSKDFYRPYAYIASVPLVLLVGTAFGLAIRPLRQRFGLSAFERNAITGGAMVVIGVLCIGIVSHNAQFASNYILYSVKDTSSLISRSIPAGSCVIFVEAGPLIAADRFIADDPNCPQIIDPFGSLLALNDKRIGQPFTQEICDLWTGALDRADFVTTAGERSSWIAYCPAVTERFSKDFRVKAKDQEIWIWERQTPRLSSP